MKIKLAYPKIPDTLDCPLKQCVAFEKYDGTNIHWVWKNGYWAEFGTRRDRFPFNMTGIRQFEAVHPELKEAIHCFDEGRFLHIFLEENQKYKDKETIIFTEFFGPNSFAGSHQPKDKMQFAIIDVQVDGKILPPEEFLEDFGRDFHYFVSPNVVFKGKFTGQLFVDVRKGKYDVKEGVVVKGIANGQVYMAKIKTEAYMEKLKDKFQDKWKEYWE